MLSVDDKAHRLDCEMAPRFIKIKANDGGVFIIPREAAMVSGTWNRMLSTESYLESVTGEISFDESSDIIGYVCDYLFYNLKYRESEGQPESEFSFPPALALQLLVAADYLDV